MLVAMGFRARLVRRLIRLQVLMERFKPVIITVALLFVAGSTLTGLFADPLSESQAVLYKVIVIADLAAIYLYVGVYTALQPWWQSRVGRSLVWKDLALSIPLWLTLLSLFFHFSRLSTKVASGVDAGALAAIAAILMARSDIWISEHAAKARGFSSVKGERLSSEAGRLSELEADVARTKLLEEEVTRLRAMLGVGIGILPPSLVSQAFDAVPDAVAIVDGEGKIVAGNAKLSLLSGWPDGALNGKPVEVLVPGNLRAAHREAREEYMERPEVRAMGARPMMKLRTRNAGDIPVDISLVPVQTSQGSYIIVTIRPAGDAKAR
jgi:PAS domain S-box-containing protein